jgi:hypothetical protein
MLLDKESSCLRYLYTIEYHAALTENWAALCEQVQKTKYIKRKSQRAEKWVVYGSLCNKKGYIHIHTHTHTDTHTCISIYTLCQNMQDSGNSGCFWGGALSEARIEV